MSSGHETPGNGLLIRTLTIRNQRGLHARASAKFVNVAGRYDAEISVSKDGATVCGTSIMGLMMLAAAMGQEIRIEARGAGAYDALAALEALIDAKFDED